MPPSAAAARPVVPAVLPGSGHRPPVPQAPRRTAPRPPPPSPAVTAASTAAGLAHYIRLESERSACPAGLSPLGPPQTSADGRGTTPPPDTHIDLTEDDVDDAADNDQEVEHVPGVPEVALGARMCGVSFRMSPAASRGSGPSCRTAGPGPGWGLPCPTPTPAALRGGGGGPGVGSWSGWGTRTPHSGKPCLGLDGGGPGPRSQKPQGGRPGLALSTLSPDRLACPASEGGQGPRGEQAGAGGLEAGPFAE